MSAGSSDDSFSEDSPRPFSSLTNEIHKRLRSLYAEEDDYDFNYKQEDDINPDETADIILAFPSPPSSTTSHSSYSRTSFRESRTHLRESLDGFPTSIHEGHGFDNDLYSESADLDSYGDFYHSTHRSPPPESVLPRSPHLPAAWRTLNPWQPLATRRDSDNLSLISPVRFSTKLSLPSSPRTNIEARVDKRRQAHIFDRSEVTSVHEDEESERRFISPIKPLPARMFEHLPPSRSPEPRSPLEPVPDTIPFPLRELVEEDDEDVGPTLPPKPLWLHRTPKKESPPLEERKIPDPSIFEPLDPPDPPQVVRNMHLIHRSEAQRQFGARPMTLSAGSVTLTRSQSLVKKLRELPKKTKRITLNDVPFFQEGMRMLHA